MSRKKQQKHTSTCPCGGEDYMACCGKYLSAGVIPATAEQLMRSRYTAYVEQNREYLLRTWDEVSRPQDLVFDDETRWLGLKALSIDAGGEHDASGVVEFIARYKIQGRAYRMHEVSRFIRKKNHWYYLDGEQPDTD